MIFTDYCLAVPKTIDALGSVSITSSFGLRTGGCLRSAAFITLKIAVFAPIAMAKMLTAIAVELQFLANIRRAKRISSGMRVNVSSVLSDKYIVITSKAR